MSNGEKFYGEKRSRVRRAGMSGKGEVVPLDGLIRLPLTNKVLFKHNSKRGSAANHLTSKQKGSQCEGHGMEAL